MQGPREGLEILDFALRYILEVKGGWSSDGWIAGVKEGLKGGLIDEGWRD